MIHKLKKCLSVLLATIIILSTAIGPLPAGAIELPSVSSNYLEDTGDDASSLSEILCRTV